MKIAAKRLLAFILCVAFCGVFCLFSSALTTNEYGLGLTATAGETDGSATVTLTLTNSNSFDVSDVSITHNVPDGLELRSEIADKNSDGILIPIGNLAAGNTYSAELVFAEIGAPVLTGDAPATAVAKTNEKAVIAAIIVTVVIVAAAIILAKKHKKAAALVMAVAMLIPTAGVFGVHAVGTDEARSFTLEDTVTLGGKEYPLCITVNYNASTAKNSYFEFETDTATDTTVTRPIADFNGVATANATVVSVKYEVRSEFDDFEVGSSGNAVLDGCEWSAENLSLKSGENNVTFIATLSDGKTQSQTHSIFYDRGETYKHTVTEEAEENGTEYVKEIINIYFDIDTTDERINEILTEIGAERVGEVNDIAMVQARIDAESLDTLNKKCEEIEKYDEVTGAGIELILPLELTAVTNDPWSTNPSATQTINENYPSGYNWHAEAIQAYSAWDYDKYFSKAKVGIIDGPVMTDHEDLSCIKFSTTSYQSDNTLPTSASALANAYHGTHVAGIIGATANNGKGGAGILWNAEIYAANFSSSRASSNTMSYIVNALSSQVTNGAKAVNLSLGLTNTNGSNPYLNPYSTADLDSTAKQCATTMNTLIKSGKEFVVVQSAGNGVIDTRLGTNIYRSVDATQNGLFASVRTNTTYGSLTTAQVKAVYDRIIIVGAAENQSTMSSGPKFRMAYFSNGGDRVDIYAPGCSIFSSVTPQANSSGTYNIYYGMLNGTSQAAPMVAAVAALCFAINPNLTGVQVKNFIKENTSYNVTDNTQTYKGTDGNTYELHPLVCTGKLLNMKLVTEAALRTVCGKADYKLFNQMVAAAQSLNPNDFTNFEIVQAILDSITPDFYNLYEFQQEQVTNKALELADAMDKLIEKVPADYSGVEAAIAEANALNKNDYVDFSGVTSAIQAVAYGKYSDEQSEVDSMAARIRFAISALVPKVEIETFDPNVIVDNTNKVVVLTEESIDSYTDSMSANGGYEITMSQNDYGTYSTGAKVTLSKEGYEDVTYVVAVLGDIDGNGKADANDAFLARMYAVGLLNPVPNAHLIAADANCDGEVDDNDFDLIQKHTILEDCIFNNYTAGA